MIEAHPPDSDKLVFQYFVLSSLVHYIGDILWLLLTILRLFSWCSSTSHGLSSTSSLYALFCWRVLRQSSVFLFFSGVFPHTRRSWKNTNKKLIWFFGGNKCSFERTCSSRNEQRMEYIHRNTLRRTEQEAKFRQNFGVKIAKQKKNTTKKSQKKRIQLSFLVKKLPPSFRKSFQPIKRATRTSIVERGLFSTLFI